MTDAPAVRLRGDGSPEGFLDQPDEFTTIRYEITEPGIALLSLDRPDKLNAFDERMIREMRAVIWRIAFDDTVRVLIITGEGRGFFAHCVQPARNSQPTRRRAQLTS